jgi:hypothetical protein
MNKTKPSKHYKDNNHTIKLLYDHRINHMKRIKKNVKHTRKLSQNGGVWPFDKYYDIRAAATKTNNATQKKAAEAAAKQTLNDIFINELDADIVKQEIEEIERKEAIALNYRRNKANDKRVKIKNWIEDNFINKNGKQDTGIISDITNFNNSQLKNYNTLRQEIIKQNPEISAVNLTEEEISKLEKINRDINTKINLIRVIKDDTEKRKKMNEIKEKTNNQVQSQKQYNFDYKEEDTLMGIELFFLRQKIQDENPTIFNRKDFKKYVKPLLEYDKNPNNENLHNAYKNISAINKIINAEKNEEEEKEKEVIELIENKKAMKTKLVKAAKSQGYVSKKTQSNQESIQSNQLQSNQLQSNQLQSKPYNLPIYDDSIDINIINPMLSEEIREADGRNEWLELMVKDETTIANINDRDKIIISDILIKKIKVPPESKSDICKFIGYSGSMNCDKIYEKIVFLGAQIALEQSKEILKVVDSNEKTTENNIKKVDLNEEKVQENIQKAILILKKRVEDRKNAAAIALEDRKNAAASIEHKESDEEEEKTEPPNLITKLPTIEEDIDNIEEELEGVNKLSDVLHYFEPIIDNIKKIKSKYKFSKLDESVKETQATIKRADDGIKQFYQQINNKLDNKIAIIDTRDKIINIFKQKNMPSILDEAADDSSSSPEELNILKNKLITRSKEIFRYFNKGDVLDEQEEIQILANLASSSLTPAAIKNINYQIDNTLVDMTAILPHPDPNPDPVIQDLLNLNRVPISYHMVVFRRDRTVGPDDDISDTESDVSDAGTVDDLKTKTYKMKKERQQREKLAREAEMNARDNAERAFRDDTILKMKQNIEQELRKSQNMVYILENKNKKLQKELSNIDNKGLSRYFKTTYNNTGAKNQTKIEITKKIDITNMDLDVAQRRLKQFEDKYLFFCDETNPQILNNQRDWYRKYQIFKIIKPRKDLGRRENPYGIDASQIKAQDLANKAKNDLKDILGKKEYDSKLNKQNEIVKRIIYKLLNLPPNTEINKHKFLEILKKIRENNPRNSPLYELINDAENLLNGNNSKISTLNEYKTLLSSFSSTIIKHPKLISSTNNKTKKLVGGIFSSTKISPSSNLGSGPGPGSGSAVAPLIPVQPLNIDDDMCDNISDLKDITLKLNYPSMFKNMYELGKKNETRKMSSTKDSYNTNKTKQEEADKQQKEKIANKTRKSAEHKAKIEKQAEEEYWRRENAIRDNKIKKKMLEKMEKGKP